MVKPNLIKISTPFPAEKVNDTIKQTAKAMPMYEIWSRSQNKMVGTATSSKSAHRVIDRRDNEYGAYDHYKKKIQQGD